MPAAKLTVVEYYSKGSRDQAILRYSLWDAEGRACYICAKRLKSVRKAQIDHVIPLKTAKIPGEFARVWAAVAPTTLPNKGVDHISNLRAACKRCNEGHRKGSKLLAAPLLGSILAGAPGHIAKALAVQRLLRKSDAIGESVVHLAAAQTKTAYETIWDADLRQALLDTLHAASATAGQTAERRDLWRSGFVVDVHMSAEVARASAALHLVSGVSLDILVEEFISTAAAEIEKQFQYAVRATYDDLRGPDVGSVDWGQVTFALHISDVEITADDWSCTATAVVLDELIGAMVQVQNVDGDGLDEEQTDDVPASAEIVLRASVVGARADVEIVDRVIHLHG